MVKIILVTHFELASGFVNCLEHILSRNVDEVSIVAVRKTEDCDRVLVNVDTLIKQIGNNMKILILADILGATPSNIASKLVRKGEVELITGLNLPMLLRAVTYCHESLDVCVEKTLEGAKSGIIYINGDSIL